MIEVFGNGELYVADHFMPTHLEIWGTITITKPFGYHNQELFLKYDTDFKDIRNRDSDVWKFAKCINASYDTRWKFEGEIEEFGFVIKYILDNWRGWKGLRK